MGSPKVTVIIPAYNAAQYLSQAIDSVLDGTFADVEVLVVDDGSTDSTADVAAEYVEPKCDKYDERVRYVYQSNQGKAVAVNNAFDRARGKYLTILDADDVLSQTSIQARFEVAEREGKGSTSVGRMQVIDDEQRVLGVREVPNTDDPMALYRSFYYRYKSPFSLNQCLIPASVVKKTGKFDPDLRRCQDIDYLIRLFNNTLNLSYVKSTVYTYRKHRSTATDRIRIRIKTIIYRSKVYYKNYFGLTSLIAVTCGLILDLGKLMFEVYGSYGK